MYAGRVAEEGPVDEVFAAPRHPYTQKLLSAFPNIHADRRTLDVIPGSPPDLRDPPPGCRFAPRCPFAMDVCTRGRAARGDVPTASASPATSTRRERRRAGHDATADAVGATARRRTLRRRADRGARGDRDRRADGCPAPPVADRRRAPAPRGPPGPFPDPWRAPRHARAAACRGVVRAVDGIDLDAPARRGPRARRRVGQRQDDDRPRHRQAHPPDRGRIVFDGATSSDLWGPARCAPTAGGSSSSSRTRTRR